MNRKHSIFRKFNKLLLIVSMVLSLPMVVYAAKNSDGTYTGTVAVSLGVSGSNSGSGSSNASGSSTHGTNEKSTGYRVYLVEKNGNSISIMKDTNGKQYILDLLFFDYKNAKITKLSLTRLGSVSGGIGYKQITTDTLVTPLAFSNGSFVGQGDTLAKQLLTKNADGVTYAQDIIEDIFSEVNGFSGDVIAACKNKDTYLVVEPLWCAYTWTSYSKANITTEKVSNTETIAVYEHLYYDRIDIVTGKTVKLDLCCKVDAQSAQSLGLGKIWQDYFYNPVPSKAGYVRGQGKLVSTYKKPASTYTTRTVYNARYSGIYDWSSSGTTVSESTGTKFYGTYYEWLKELKSIGSNGGFLAGPKKLLGSSLYISKDMLGLSAGTNLTSGCPDTWDTIGNKGYGIHIYSMEDIGIIGDPIHTKNPVNPTPPSPPEKPKKTTPPDKPFDNTGKSTIIKVYGNIYKDGSTTYHIDNIATYSETNTTDWLIIEDEPTYKLQQWVVSDGTPDTNYTATQWLTGFNKSILFTNSSSGYKLTYTKDEQFKIGKGNTIYLLYLKPIPPLETSDKSIPDTPDPNDTYPENPYNPTPKPDKQGSFNIIKVYAILDEYNGKVISSNTYTQQSTTPFIKIESTPESSTWTLAQWKVTNKYNQSITANDWCGEATTKDQLSKFYLNHFYDISTTSTNKSKFGTVYGIGTSPCTKYISNGNTIYILFVKTNGDATYDGTKKTISESYITKLFSTAGYWNYNGYFVSNDMSITVKTDSGDVTETLRDRQAPLRCYFFA